MFEKIREKQKRKRMIEIEIQEIHKCLPETSKNNVKLKEMDSIFKPMILGTLIGILITYIFALIGVFY